MAFVMRVGSFAKATGAAPTTNTITGLPFAPTAVKLFCTLATATDTMTAHAMMAVGMSDGTDDYSACSAIEDAAVTTNANRRHALKVLTILGATGTMVAEGDLTLTADGFTVAWSTNNAVAYLIGYVAYGGVSAKLKVYTAPTGGVPRDVSYTGAGFLPTCAFTASDADDTNPSGGADDTSADLMYGFHGNVLGASGGAAICVVSEDGVAVTNARQRLLNACVQTLSLKGGVTSDNGNAEVKTWDADGMTLTWNLIPGNAFYFAVLYLKDVLTAPLAAPNTPTATGTEALTGFGFAPTGVEQFSGSQAASSAIVATTNMAIGAASAAGTEVSAWLGDTDAASTSEADCRFSNTKVINLSSPNAPPVLRVASDLNSFDAGGLTWNHTTVHTSGLSYYYLAMGPVAVAVTRRRVGPAFGSANAMVA